MYPDQLGVGDKGSNIEFVVELLKVVFVPQVSGNKMKMKKRYRPDVSVLFHWVLVLRCISVFRSYFDQFRLQK